jgi:hypothetical protein
MLSYDKDDYIMMRVLTVSVSQWSATRRQAVKCLRAFDHVDAWARTGGKSIRIALSLRLRVLSTDKSNIC